MVKTTERLDSVVHEDILLLKVNPHGGSTLFCGVVGWGPRRLWSSRTGQTLAPRHGSGVGFRPDEARHRVMALRWGEGLNLKGIAIDMTGPAPTPQ